MSDSVLWSLVRNGIPILSTFKLFMLDQNNFAESEQIDTMNLLWASLVALSLCVFLRALLGTGKSTRGALVGRLKFVSTRFFCS